MTGRHIACETCAIRHRAVCGALSNEEISHLNAIARFKRYSPGQNILRDNDEPSFFANVVGGVVKLTKSLADGRQQIVGLQFPSDFLGRPFRDRHAILRRGCKRGDTVRVRTQPLRAVDEAISRDRAAAIRAYAR